MANEVVAAAAAELARFRIDRLDQVRETMLSSIAREREALKQLAKSADDEFLETLADEDHFLDEAGDMVGGLLLVGLYSVVENMTKRLLTHRFSVAKAKDCYQIGALKDLFKDELHSDLETVPGFAQIDKLRDRNNKVKHGGDLGQPPLDIYEEVKHSVASYLEHVGLVVVPSG